MQKPTKIDYIMYYREQYDNGLITLDQYGEKLRDIRQYLNYVDMLNIERMKKR